jgi:hypothetical protein
MKNYRIKNVFDQSVTAAVSRGLLYSPHSEDATLKGILISDGVSLSLSFGSGTELQLNAQMAYSNKDIAPDQRILRIEYPLDGTVIKGVVSRGEGAVLPAIAARVFFIIEQKEQ